MDFNEYKTFCETLPNGKGKELIDFHLAQVAAEKETHIKETNQRNHENEKLRKYKIAFEGLGYKDDVDLNEFTKKLKTEPEQALQQKDMTLADVTKKLNDITTQFTTAQQELVSERMKAKTEKIKGVLLDSFKGKVYAHDIVSGDLVSSGRVDLDNTGKVVFVNEDKTTKKLEDGIKDFMTSRPDLVINEQRPGGGSRPTGGGSDPTTDQERLKTLRGMGGIVLPKS